MPKAGHGAAPPWEPPGARGARLTSPMTDLWSRVSAKGVLVGGILDVGATYALSIPLMAAIMIRLNLTGLPGPEGDAALMRALRPGSPYYLVGLLLGSACSILGGYVAARLAKHDGRLNGALSAWLVVLLGIYSWATGADAATALEHIGYLALSPATGALGGYLWERTGSTAPGKQVSSAAEQTTYMSSDPLRRPRRPDGN